MCRATGRRVFVTDLGGRLGHFRVPVRPTHWFDGHLHISEYSRAVFGHRGSHAHTIDGGGLDTAKFSPGAAGAREAVPVRLAAAAAQGRETTSSSPCRPACRSTISDRRTKDATWRLPALAGANLFGSRHDCATMPLVRAYRRAGCDGPAEPLPDAVRGRRTSRSCSAKRSSRPWRAAFPSCAPTSPACRRWSGRCDRLRGPPNDPEALGEHLCWLRDHPMLKPRQWVVPAWMRPPERFTWPQVVQRCLDAYKGALAADRVSLVVAQ